MKTKDISLCAINNIQSGTCSEDCSFCTQAVRHKVPIKRYDTKPAQQIVSEAVSAKQNKAVGYCLVSSTAYLDDKMLEFLCKTAKKIKSKVNINLIACNGMASLEQLKELKKAGFDSYNHNLETAQNYYKQVCTTHSWSERYDTCNKVKQAGLKLCSGGIFGLGESHKDRVDMVSSLKELNPNSCAINFYHPNQSLKLKTNNISKTEAFDMIRYITKELQNTKKIMIAGGREYMFGASQYEVFEHGANSIVIGDYLTTSGEEVSKEIQTLENLGYNIQKVCH
jgi:biotin synthase